MSEPDVNRDETHHCQAMRELQQMTDERDAARAEAERFRIDMGEADAEVEEMRTERDGLFAEVERLRAALVEVLGEFTDKGSIGAIHNVLRSRWVNVGTMDRWSKSLQPVLNLEEMS